MERELARLVELQRPKRGQQEPARVAEAGRRIHTAEAVRRGREEVVHKGPVEAVRTVQEGVVHRDQEAARRDLAAEALHMADRRDLAAHRDSIAGPTAPRHRHWDRLPELVVQAKAEEVAAHPAGHPKDPHTGVVAAAEAPAARHHMDLPRHPGAEAQPAVPGLQKDYHKPPVVEEQVLLAQEFQAEEQHRNHMDLPRLAAAAAALRMDLPRLVAVELRTGWREAAAAAVVVEHHRDWAYQEQLVQKDLLRHHRAQKEAPEELLLHKGRQEGHRTDSAAAAVDHMPEAEHQKDSQEGLLLEVGVIQSHLVVLLEARQEASPTQSRKQTYRKDSTCFSTVTLVLARSCKNDKRNGRRVNLFRPEQSRSYISDQLITSKYEIEAQTSNRKQAAWYGTRYY